MSVFSARPLGILENIYRFVGGQRGPSDVSLEAAVQLVHDVSRQSEMGSAQSAALGFFWVGEEITHVGTGNIFSTQDPYAGPFKDAAPEDVDVWIIDALCTSDDSADFDFARMGLKYPVLPGAFPTSQTHLLFQWDTPVGNLENSGDGVVPAIPMPLWLPKYIPHGSELLIRTNSDTSGTVAIEVWALCWAGARGALPPGLP